MPKKDPQKRTNTPTQPPPQRSRAALGLTAAAAEGRFMLQVCPECRAVQYPPRDACVDCLDTALQWQDITPTGQLLADTTVRTSTNLYFRERGDWRVGTVELDAGPKIVCHLAQDCSAPERVTLLARLDRSGQGVLVAQPENSKTRLADDPQLKALTSDPRHARVLVTDLRNANTPALVEHLLAAGAETVFVGESEAWRKDPQRDALAAIPGVEIMPLDVTDTNSVRQLAAEIGGKIEILINNGRFLRPARLPSGGDTVFAAQEMDVNYLGLLRLAQGFGPALASRTADGQRQALAWVNILSIFALNPVPGFDTFAASQAAARSLSLSMRATYQSSGLRVMNVYVGATEDVWHQPVHPPKQSPRALARDLVAGLQDGLEDVVSGDTARDLMERFREHPGVFEREVTFGEWGV
ncbi:SDR family NAD(P)-dependent oxidoreductase [Tateyamaria omphalii]|uniref:SDR family NAD(P)-dependent oxidoreductase n=1 Tax=Tateyamaria omphalii TaxID=299262 RepID=UPI0021BDA895|nr:SDR family NAD(P)-dependent oxidoreductase [Tateyamaria omphalii]